MHTSPLFAIPVSVETMSVATRHMAYPLTSLHSTYSSIDLAFVGKIVNNTVRDDTGITPFSAQ
jgi:hypothetical protein